jgi:pimeloyl-ACP methyl ester carboxylesterase
VTKGDNMMTTFLLVHGAWHGAWCWVKTAALLESAGHKVVSIDLPGHGDDTTPVNDVSLAAYAEATARAAAECTHPLVAVGHSMGGLVISAAAELAPEHFDGLVYLCAVLLRDGETVGSATALDTEGLIFPALVPSADGLSGTIRSDALKEVFYADCSDDDVAYAAERLCPEALGILEAPLRHTEERAGSIARAYLECSRDNAITPALQRKMYAASPCDVVQTLDSDHSPFLSHPEQLTEALTSIAARILATD